MHHVGRFLASASALLLASGCVTGIDVGHDGTGGSTTTTTTGASSSSAGSGGGVPTVSMCTSPGALLCPWGQLGGPCGGGGVDCDPASGGLCVGASPGAPGTCALSAEGVQPPGGPCGGGVYASLVCPWGYVCNGAAGPDAAGMGTCTPANCVLSGPTPFVSAASITIDGDGPTQHDDFACAPPYGGSQLTGEANGVFSGSALQLTVTGCASADGYAPQGSLILLSALTGVGTTHEGTVSYVPPPALGDTSTSYESTGVLPPTITVTEVSASLLRGSFDAVMQFPPPSADTKHLTGTFEICRLPDSASAE